MCSSCFLSLKQFLTCNNKLLILQRLKFLKRNLLKNLRRYINTYICIYVHTCQVVFLGLLAWCFKEYIEKTRFLWKKLCCVLVFFLLCVIPVFLSLNQFTWKWSKTFQYIIPKINPVAVLKIGMLAVTLQSFCNVSDFSDSFCIFAISTATSFSNAFQTLAYITMRSLWQAAI